mmetsp:Transcript_17079/g.60752  ORF Transcript_17079/g.60752 Transcript_17079/m.60752 type:complete len:206 (+) Transcript_17079:861-1478(+)
MPRHTRTPCCRSRTSSPASAHASLSSGRPSLRTRRRLKRKRQTVGRRGASREDSWRRRRGTFDARERRSRSAMNARSLWRWASAPRTSRRSETRSQSSGPSRSASTLSLLSLKAGPSWCSGSCWSFSASRLPSCTLVDKRRRGQGGAAPFPTPQRARTAAPSRCSCTPSRRRTSRAARRRRRAGPAKWPRATARRLSSCARHSAT